MKTTRMEPRYLPGPMVIIVALLVGLLGSSGVAGADGYTDSAHGDSLSGVNRSTAACEYWPGGACAVGDCAQCHDTFDPAICGVNDLMLFATDDADFCLKCHENTTNYAASAIVNRSYSYRAGGYTTDSLNDIREAFNSTTHHNLDDIITFIDGKWGFTAESNPCLACHNPHLAQGDPEAAPNDAKSDSTRGFLVSRPSDHDADPWNLWGDDATEKMSAYTADYQAPYRRLSTTTYEPDGSTTTDGSNLTDFNTFCTDCHNTTDTIYSTRLGRDLRQIDWDNEIHGKGDADGSVCGDNPYPSGDQGLGKVLSCLDCHEPHGSSNETLIRKEVNSGTLSVNSITQNGCPTPSAYTKVMANLCNRCHKDDYQLYPGECPSNGWYKIHHDTDGSPTCNSDYPYTRSMGCTCHYRAPMGGWGCDAPLGTGRGELTPITCTCCHYHGSIVTNCNNAPTTRRTF